MLKLNSLNMGSADPKKLVEFYSKVFDKKPDMEEEGWGGFLMGSTFLGIGPHDQVKGMAKEPQRLMFNLETDDVKGEFERIQKVGATVIAKPYQMGEEGNQAWIATFADPEGNYFQLMTPWKG